MDISLERTIPRLVHAAAKAYGNRNAIEDGDVTLSFEELERESLRAARAFNASGVEHGDRIAIWAPNIYEWILAAIGLQSTGAILVPLNTRLKGSEAGYILRKSRARMIFMIGNFLDADYVGMLADQDLPDLREIVVFRDDSTEQTTWADFLARGEGVPEEEARERALAVGPDDLADIMFTSGTTGQPKGVMTAHEQNLRGFKAWTEVVGLAEGDRYLIVNPFFHAFGYKSGWLSSIMRGATILPHQVFDVPAVLERASRERISVLPGPPTLYQSILAHPDRDAHDLSCLRLAVTGAAAIPVELIHRMRRDLSFDTVITGYGLTEASGIATMCRFDDSPETIALTSGRAIPDVEVLCVDDDGREVPRGEPGEVVIRGYNVMRGYLDDEAETAATIDAEGWLHTGDIGVMDDAGYLKITDRKKDMFIMGGFNCYPAEIESLMFEHQGIAQVAVIGIPDERMGEVGMAFVVPLEGVELTEEEISAWCRDHMANYKVPRRVALVDELPTNATGKITKFVLREWATEGGGEKIN
ncbi:FadD3 family acyl-CoA ligase [Myxococcota bacterium]|nr:FadD3 family acyl-CoA ligase [Myxococcota bacterium]